MFVRHLGLGLNRGAAVAFVIDRSRLRVVINKLERFLMKILDTITPLVFSTL